MTSAQRRLKTGAAHALLMRSARIDQVVLQLTPSRFRQRAARYDAAFSAVQHTGRRLRDGSSQSHDHRNEQRTDPLH